MTFSKGREAPFSKFPVIILSHIDVSSIDFVIDYSAFELLHRVTELPQNTFEFLASISSQFFVIFFCFQGVKFTISIYFFCLKKPFFEIRERSSYECILIIFILDPS